MVYIFMVCFIYNGLLKNLSKFPPPHLTGIIEEIREAGPHLVRIVPKKHNILGKKGVKIEKIIKKAERN